MSVSRTGGGKAIRKDSTRPHDDRKIAYHFPPFTEEQARQVDEANRIAWRESINDRRWCQVMAVIFWVMVGMIIYRCHLNHWF